MFFTSSFATVNSCVQKELIFQPSIFIFRPGLQSMYCNFHDIYPEFLRALFFNCRNYPCRNSDGCWTLSIIFIELLIFSKAISFTMLKAMIFPAIIHSYFSFFTFSRSNLIFLFTIFWWAITFTWWSFPNPWSFSIDPWYWFWVFQQQTNYFRSTLTS